MKTKNKIYNVNRRFTIWVETKLTADNFHEAEDKALALKLEDFVDCHSVPIDWETLPGTSVSEDFP